MTDKFRNKYRIASTRLQNWDYRWNGKYFITICTAQMQHLFGEIQNGQMHLSHVGVLADVFWHEIKNHAKNVELDAFTVMPNHVHGIIILNNKFDYSDVPDYSRREIKIEPIPQNDPMHDILMEVDDNYFEFLKSQTGDSADGDISDSHGDPNGNFDSNPDGNSDGKSDGDLNSNSDGDSDSNPDGDSNPYPNPDGDFYHSTDRACPVSTTPMPGSPDSKSPGNPNTPPQKKSPGSQRFQNIGKNSISSIIGSYKSAVSKHAHRLGFEMEWKERFHDHIIHNDEELRRIRRYIINNPKKWGKDKFHGK